MASNLPQLEPVERLSPRVIRILGGNPGNFTLQGTNTYLLGTGPERILIDTGAGLPAWRESLQSVLAAEQCTVSHALLTHYHYDHVDGIADLQDLCPGVALHKIVPPAPSASVAVEERLGAALRPLAPGQVVRVPGAAVRVSPCPGHTKDHAAFVLEPADPPPDPAGGGGPPPADPDAPRAVFTGDAILGHGTAVFDDALAYEASLNMLAALAEADTGSSSLAAAAAAAADGVRGYPAHGALITALAPKVAMYRRHRELREREILRALREGARTAQQVVEDVYSGLEGPLQRAAAKGVQLVLAKMEAEQRVRRGGAGEWAVCEEKAGL